MSTATRFKYYRPFPFCPSSGTPGTTFDYLEVSLADAMSFWWNLESLEFVSTGSQTDGLGASLSLAWTLTNGPTESLPFAASRGYANGGSYYYSGSPATSPISKVCFSTAINNERPLSFSLLGGSAFPGVQNNIILEFRIKSSAIDGNVRLYYRVLFECRNNVGIGTPSPGSGGLIAINPATVPLSGISGTVPTTGTFDILGLSFDWSGGYYEANASRVYTWISSSGLDLSATSSAFTY